MDSDFVKLAEKKSTVGVLYFAKRVPRKKMAADIMKALNSLDEEDIRNELIYLPWGRQ